MVKVNTGRYQDVDREYQEEDTHIECENCKAKTFELANN